MTSSTSVPRSICGGFVAPATTSASASSSTASTAPSSRGGIDHTGHREIRCSGTGDDGMRSLPVRLGATPVPGGPP
ncbi:hypothetical protein [Pseudonocardia sp. EC080625-04]|uniref:hypothetical protein n=1 Tax=Pseudonocardia sp. EC080625-04 TaxID=1096868 RepID=UPI001EE6C780|nr:hypothetical protein [Pseudonocardia sp. EC080625-04]